MSKARLIITAVVVEGRSKSEVARDYDVSRYWVQQLVRRYLAEGEAAYQPRSRRPHTSPHAVAGRGRGPDRPAPQGAVPAGPGRRRRHHPQPPGPADARSGQDQHTVPAVSTIWRILIRRGFVTPQPQKRPRSSWHRFEAEQPNERWQADTTHWRLADGTEVEILNILDDHSRLALASVPRRTITGPDVLHTFQDAFLRWGIPASVLTDNGAVFTGLPRRGGRVALEIELGRLGVRFDHSRANHPQTAGKVERFQQTEKKWLAAQPPAKTIAGLPRQLSRFRRYYNEVRPHRAIGTQDPLAGLHRPTQGHRDRPLHRPALPGPSRPRRQGRHRHTALQQPTAPHRHRPPPGRHPDHPARRRPAHPDHRPRHRRTHPRAGTGPHPRLPTPRATTRPTTQSSPEMQRCPETPVNGVPGHHTGSGGRI